MKRRRVFWTISAGTIWDLHVKEIIWTSASYHLWNLALNESRVLTVRTRSIKLLERNRCKSSTPGIRQWFLRGYQNKQQKEKMHNLDFIKINTFVLERILSRKWKEWAVGGGVGGGGGLPAWREGTAKTRDWQVPHLQAMAVSLSPAQGSHSGGNTS